jgi:protein-L-isoaspartate O-methyltransferase
LHSKRCQDIAHRDQPIRDGNIHISAPHIYGSVLEALELKNDAGLSFLNAGSGTGYLTCIAASILGPRSVHYCVEIHEDVIRHSKEAIANWKENNPNARGTPNIKIIHGNALELNTHKGECVLGFDRIYIGAAIHKFNLHMFKKMLKPGGILVGPGEFPTSLKGLAFILFIR